MGLKLVTAALLFTATGCGVATDALSSNDRKPAATLSAKNRDSLDAINRFKQRDSSLMRFFRDSYGFVVFPSVGKGAFGIGAAHGTGEVFEKSRSIGRAGLTQITIGLQIGGQSYSEIIFFKNKRAIDRFKDGNFEFSAQASAVVAKEGAGHSVDYNDGVAIFVLVKGGLMLEASVGGQKFSFSRW